jgi:hypothetical protein
MTFACTQAKVASASGMHVSSQPTSPLEQSPLLPPPSSPQPSAITEIPKPASKDSLRNLFVMPAL